MSKRETVWGTRWMYGILACLGLTSVSMSVHADDTTLWLKTVQSAGAPSGLCVQLGAREVAGPAALARSGRFLVQVLERDRSAREASRKSLEGSGLYGLVSVDEWREADRLPYTENLIDLLIVTDPAAKALSGKEILRVLCPNGVVMAAPQTLGKRALQSAGFADIQSLRVAGTTWTAARKPWPSEMDEWTHPRHSASGNAVSRDLLVGPPRRVRWVVNAPDEVRGLVTAKGRNIYGAALARNGFNGLRLWARDLIRPATKGSFVLRNLPRGMPYPIIVGDRVYAVAKDTLVALDASTGRTVQSYPDAGHPRELLCDGGLLIVADAMSVRALEAESGRLVWTVRIANPRNVVAGDGYVAFTAGQPNRGQKPELVTLNRGDGSVRWRRNDLDWAGEVDRIVYHRGLLAYECSTFNDFSPGNATRVLAAEDGRVLWEREYPPGMNHMRQARALFIGDRLWILHGGKVHDPSKPRYDKFERLPVQCRALDPQTGKELTTFPAGLTHCFPPVATPRYLFAGEMNLTDLVTGRIEANHITKAACGRDFGWVPANGLIYVTPKHCVCWPMLRGYAALAPERPAGSVHDWNVDQIDFILERGTAVPKEDTQESAADWPIYRHDPWRSASTATAIPSTLRTLWSVHAGSWPQAGPIVEDWRENPFTKGPVTAPVVAGGRVYVAQPDAHRVSAFDTDSGRLLWQFTANGRVDTAPTIHRGLCLFGTNLGWVYCVDAATGRLVWRLRAAPVDERIVAYGQVESPWPVPGSVLVVGGTAYFAAGRQPLADGGILVFAVDPRTGQRRWVQRLDTVPQRGFYESSALEFDNFDLLFREGERVSMSRWQFDADTGTMSCDRWNAYAKLNTGGGDAWVPRGAWSYPPRHQRRIKSYRPRRSLVTFRDNVVYGCMQDAKTLFRRDFHLDEGEKFETRWVTGWGAGQLEKQGKPAWPNDRLAEKAKWKRDVFGPDSRQTIDALVLAGGKLVLVGSEGELQVRSADDGRLLDTQQVPAPMWDGLAVANGRVFLTTADGQLLCLGK